jgi:hypothetical protein
MSKENRRLVLPRTFCLFFQKSKGGQMPSPHSLAPMSLITSKFRAVSQKQLMQNHRHIYGLHDNFHILAAMIALLCNYYYQAEAKSRILAATSDN